MVNAALAASLAFGGQPLRGAEEEAEGQVWQKGRGSTRPHQ